jgi:hypothetical protein
VGSGLSTGSVVLEPGGLPAGVVNGQIWYDSGLQKFRVYEDGQASDMKVPGAAGTEIGSLYKSDLVATNSQTYVDAMGGQSVVPPLNASYFVIFEGEITDATPNLFIAITKNGVEVTDSEREYGPLALGNSFIMSTVLPSLLTSDNIAAVFKRDSGGNPSAQVAIRRRRLTLIQKA